MNQIQISITGMIPDKFCRGDAPVSIRYHFAVTPFGDVLTASTPNGLCHLGFADDPAAALQSLREQFPQACFQEADDEMQQRALLFLTSAQRPTGEIRLHLKGTAFQLRVWQALLQIPEGATTTYRHIAEKIGHPKACRAVGTAVGANPVAVVIPCHRVIRSDGQMGQYHWGRDRKAALLARESKRTH